MRLNIIEPNNVISELTKNHEVIAVSIFQSSNDRTDVGSCGILSRRCMVDILNMIESASSQDENDKSIFFIAIGK